jgi:hypothetical protein
MILGCLFIAQLLLRDRFKALGIHAKSKPDLRGILRDQVFQLSAAGLSFMCLGASSCFADSAGIHFAQASSLVRRCRCSTGLDL